MAAAQVDSRTAADSVVLGACTAVSRATGLVRVVAVGAVLGPTHFANAFGLTNQFPNLVFYGFLAGSLFCSLLVPALVRHIDGRDTERTAAIAGGFLGTTWSVMAVVAPSAAVLLPLALTVSTFGASGGGTQTAHVWLLAWLTVPQIFLYTVATCATAVLNAHGRFALAAIAPAVENVGVVTVLALVALWYGDASSSGSPPVAAVLLLGGGSTAAVALHAALPWCAVRRCGITLLPRWGWRDAEVMSVVRRAVRSLAQAGLLALQTLTLLLLASRVAGGTVALQVALNFYYLPLALVATPVGLALLPKLARLEERRRSAEATEAFAGGLNLAWFLTLPAAVGYMLLAVPLTECVLVGAMATDAGTAMVASTLVALATGMAGQAAFVVATQAAYARGEPHLPLRCMAVQAFLCLVLSILSAVLTSGERLVALLGASYALASLVGGALLVVSCFHGRSSSARRLLPSSARTAVGAAALALAVSIVLRVLDLDGATRQVLAVALGATTLLGAVVYLVIELSIGSAEARTLVGVVQRTPRERAVTESDSAT